MPPEPDDTPQAPARDYLGLAAPAAVFVITVVTFLPVLSNGLVNLDDTLVLVQNTGYRGLGWENIVWMFRANVACHWQPLTFLSYAIDYELAGGRLDPGQIHATSLFLHAVDAVLLYAVALRLFRAAGLRAASAAPAFAAAAAILWAVHPLRVESVAWATERRDVLSLLFWLGAALAYLRAFPVGAVRPASWWAYGASVALLALSLLSKAWGVTFFAVVAVLDWYPLRRLPGAPWRGLRRDHAVVLLQKLPYVLLAAGSAYKANVALRAVGSLLQTDYWPTSARIAQASYGLIWYLGKTLWPTHLAPLYDLPQRLDPLAPRYVASYVLVGMGVVGLLLLRRRAPAVAAAFLLYAIIVAPVLGLTQAGDQFTADRYAYISTIPLFVLMAGALLRPCQRIAGSRAAAVPLAATPLIIVCMMMSWRQCSTWKDSATLWRNARMPRPDRAMSYVNYGLCLEEEGRIREAAEEYRISTALQPAIGQSWLSLGGALRKLGDVQGAEAAYRRSAQHHRQPYIPLVGLGNMLLAAGRADEGLAAFRDAVRSVEEMKMPEYRNGVPYLCLGAELERRGELQEAASVFEKALAYPACREQARGHLDRLRTE